jgi:hypothetical protein
MRAGNIERNMMSLKADRLRLLIHDAIEEEGNYEIVQQGKRLVVTDSEDNVFIILVSDSKREKS